MEALYRKYRPTTFKDVVGQEHIERTLKNAIEQGKVSHAYLFCGPRGTGKTTMARILAKALLCEKGPTVDPDGTCPECEAIAQGTHPDVYELDAASRTGVDNVREEIIARVNYAPTRGAWKVYIIDEVHMLTTAAFNALLKTLEEPPAHIVFILCTTDPQKVPDTIQSRCQRFDFHRISNEAIVSRLGAICVEEGVDFEGEALDLIAYRADGGMRNALTSLEQLMAFGGGHVTLEGAQNLLGSLDETDLSEIVLAIGKRDAVACFNWVEHYIETGADLAQFVDDLSEHIRNMYLLSMAGIEAEIPVSDATRKAMVDQLRFYGQDRLSRMLVVLGDLSKELRSASNPRLSFEIALTRMIRPESDLTLEALAERIEELERKLATGQFVQSANVSGVSQQVASPQPAQVVAYQQTVTQAVPEMPVASQPTQVAAELSSQREAFGVQGAPAAQEISHSESISQPNIATRANDISAQASKPVVQSGQSGTHVSQPAAQGDQPSAHVSQSTTQNIQSGGAQVGQPNTPSASSASLPIDVTNPAAVQRFWHTVTTSLRKANPARGVLFMNAKIAGEANGSGLVITFGKDNGFAYTAAQKPEVQQLLTQTIAQVAGGQIPYRLVLENGASQTDAVSSMMSAPSLVSNTANSVSGGNGATSASAGSAQGAASSQAERVRAAVRAAQESARQAAQQQASVAPSGSSSANSSVVSAPSTGAASATMSASSTGVSPAAETAPSAAYDAPSAPADDQVPLEAYGDAFFSEDESEQPIGQSANQSAIQSNQQPIGHNVGQSAGRFTDQSTAQSSQQPSSQTAVQPTSQVGTVTNETSAPITQIDPAGDEASQIKAILSNSFGEGIKFEELPE